MIERISHILEECELPKPHAAEVQYCLEVAAFLGPQVELDEWCCACEVGGLGELVSLAKSALVERDGGKWDFPDPSMRQQLIEEAEREGRSRRHHNACAQALFTLYPQDASGVAARRAAHLVEAGRYEEALQPLLHAFRDALSHGDIDACRGYLDRREHLLDALGIGADKPRRVQNDWRRAYLHHTTGERDLACELASRSRQVLEHTDWATERGHVAILLGRILRDDGDLEAARGFFKEAISHFGKAGDDHGLAVSRASLGYIELQASEYEQARQTFTRALTAFEALEDSFMVANVLSLIGHTWLVGGHTDEAMDCVERARLVAREAGHKSNEASAWVVRGEMARASRDWQEARRCYSAAAKLYEDADNRGVHIAQYNLAVVEVGARNFGVAMSLLEELEQCYPEVGFSSRLPLVYVAMMACAAGVGDWRSFSRHHERTTEAIVQYEASHIDLAWMAKEAAGLANEQGNPSAQRRCVELACAQFERIGQREQAEKLRATTGGEPML